MALVTSILTGGTNNHQTTAEEANAWATDFVSEGIVGTVGNTSGVSPATGGFAVNAQSTPDTTVAITTGVAYVTATPTSQDSQALRVENTTTASLTISANSSGSTKYDWIYISISAANAANPNVAGDDVATIVASRSSSSSTDDGTPPTYGYPLAVVTVANGFSAITNGNIRDLRSQVALNTGTSGASDGWLALSGTPTVSSGYNKGNKEYDLTFASSMASILTPGMRLKVTRATTPPTQCADLEASSSQYASKSSPTGITFTDDFTCEAWVKLESYAVGIIVSRYNGTNGWRFWVNSDGTLIVDIQNTGRRGTTYQSLPLNRWVHVAATMDASGGAATMYIDGVSVPRAMSGASNSLTQAGNLELGSQNGGATNFDGKISDVRVWSAIRTATQIRDNMNQQLVGNETNLVAYFKLNGDFNDSTSNANNLTASGGAAATDSDNPMNATEYAIVTKVATTTVTVFTGTDYNIPNMTLSTPYYSTQDVPYGFPRDGGKWRVSSLFKVQTLTTSNANYGSFASNGWSLTVPIGAWAIGYSLATFNSTTTSVHFNISPTSLSGVAIGSEDTDFTHALTATAAAASRSGVVTMRRPKTLTAQETWVLYTQGATTSAGIDADNQLSEIFAECAYV